MTPHPELAAILLDLAANPLPDPATLPIDEARRNFDRNAAQWNTPLPEMSARDVSVGGVPCAFLNEAQAGLGLMVMVHGGGWTFGNPGTHARFARLIAQFAGIAVLVPDYRLAPEHPAPAAIDDVLAVIADLDAIVPPETKLVLGGDSAGACIALAAAQSRPARAITFLSLMYGCFAPVFDTQSHDQNGDGRFGLSTERMRWYWGNWLGHRRHPRGAPLGGDCAGLPPCHLLAAALDPLCDDSFLMARHLVAAGVPTRLDVIPGVNHGFLQMSARLGPAMQATRTIAAEIAASLTSSHP